MDLATHRRLHEAIVRLADGDRRIFPALFQELWPAILRFVSRSLRNAADAEDVAQQVLINICFRIAEFDRRRDGVAWAFGIAAWEVRTYLRRVQRRRELPDSALADVPTDADTQEEVLIRESLNAALEDLGSQLPDADRALLLSELRDDEARTAATPAQRKRRQRALGRLREMWRTRYG